MALTDNWVKKEFTPQQEQVGLEEERKRAFLEEAGIEGMDAAKLRKTMLSADEVIIAKQEQLDEIRIRKSRKSDWEEYVDEKRRWGRALHHSDIVWHLEHLITDLYVTDGMIRNTLGLYRWDGYEKFDATGRVGGTVFLGWIHNGWNPEYEIDLTNDVGVAVGQKRGWRTILLRLICRRDRNTFVPRSIITEDQMYNEFGFPTNGETASNFRKQLYRFRHTSPEQARLEHQLMNAAHKYRYA